MEKDIISKLKLYIQNPEIAKDSKLGGSNQFTASPKYKYEIDKIIDGYDWVKPEYAESACFIIENHFPLSYLYGGYCFSKALDITEGALKKICPDIKSSAFGTIQSERDIKITDFLFMDTETTGLSGGTGTVAFLIGVGFFTENAFIVRQYFMRDYNEEITMLEALSELLVSYRGLVTFNGKAFDWNLLQTRYTFNRLKIPIKQIMHMDLLYPSRRIWKFKLESCALSSLEENILGEYRVNDIPGAMIPSVYFKYLVDRDAREIKRVIKHNEQDILSMVSLLLKINELLQNPIEETEGEEELLGLSRVFEICGESENYAGCMEKCLESDDNFIRGIALKKLSLFHKRKGDYEKAVKYWNSMLSQNENFNLYPMIELAKYYEHKEKNIKKALEITEKAVQMTYKMGINNNIYKDDLKKRLNRLKKKAGKKENA